MDRDTVINHIESNNQLLSLPQVLAELLKEVSKENLSPDILARIILKDPSLTSRILRLSNSTYYQRLAEIKTVNQAVAVLGVTTVKCMALSTSVFHPDKVARDSGVNPKSFFAYVLSVATASQKIARATRHRAPEEALIAGLLCDIGVLFFAHHYPREYRPIVTGKVAATSLSEAEQKVFGIDHTEVGCMLSRQWRLPGFVTEAIAGHHQVGSRDNDNLLCDIVRLAVRLSSEGFSGFEVNQEGRLGEITILADRLSLSRDVIDEISSSLLSGTLEAAEFLDIDIGDTEEMLIRANQGIWESFLTIDHLFKERSELSRKLLEEERTKGALESKNIALATLSHYLNNAVMGIYGRSQLLRLLLDKRQEDRLIKELPASIEVIDQAVQKIVAVLEEMKSISPLDYKRFDNLSQALNIDDRIQQRLEKMSDEAPMGSRRIMEEPEKVSAG
ncbi:MAG: HDOD domain-containing protein [bacterium]